MEIEYGLTLDDIEAFARFHLKHGPKVKPNPVVRTTTLTFFAFVIFTMVILASFLRHGLENNLLAGLCYGIPVGLYVGHLFLVLLGKKTFASTTVQLYDNPQSRWFLAWRRLRIDAEGFEITNEYEQLRSSWSIVCLIDSTDDHAFFYTTMLQAHLIPSRAFPNKENFEAFIDLACQYHKGKAPLSGSPGILDAFRVQSTGITRPPHS